MHPLKETDWSVTLEEVFGLKITPPPNTLVVYNSSTSKPIITVTREGRLYWGEREVETDEEFRGMMMEWAKIMIGNQ